MFNFRAMVRVLAQHDVEFAIVGGLAGVMQGAPIHTQDLDVLYSLEAPNPARMARAFRLAVEAGRISWETGLHAPTDKASASSPLTGFLR